MANLNRLLVTIMLVLLPLAAKAHAQPAPVKIQPSAAVTAKAQVPAPSTKTEQKTSVGGKQATVKTANHAQDTDSFWVESIDFDGDGSMETADLVWDDEDGILFLHDEGPFTCQSGGQGDGEILMAIYGEKNTRKRPAGSGWWVVGLDAGECGAKAAGLFGCRFDTKGQATDCGAAVVQDATKDIAIKP